MLTISYCVTTILLLGSVSKGALPEDDFRIINKEDLLATDTDIFEDKRSKSFSQLLFDVARDQVIVGARDAIYRLSLRDLRSLERASWPAPPQKSKLCQDKGQTEDDCHNYVKVLLSHEHRLFACGTQAFSPVCSWRQIESVGSVSSWVPGVANCPYNPHSNVTAILASNGDYYAGTPTDFIGSETTICKSRGAAVDTGTICTKQYEANWLNEPQFVGSFEDDLFVYFVFREVAVEFMNCGKIIYSRISRICKNDTGGFTHMRGHWGTFLKARLKCSVPGDLPFNYDEVQSMEYLPQEKILVATFTTPVNSIAGSAVCIYNMSDIHSVFDGSYKVQDTPTSTWEHRAPSPQARDHFRCLRNTREQTIQYHSYRLMYDAIQPVSGEPIYRVTSQRFSQITVDVTETRAIDKQLVLFVATDQKEVLKLTVLPRLDGACLVERWRLADDKGGFDVQKMQFVKETMSVYIGSTEGVLRIGSERCSRWTSRAACVGARDPHCGWEDGRERCVRAGRSDPLLIQDTAVCSSRDLPVDGGWSVWSPWQPCEQAGSANSQYGEKPDMCMCRTRACNNPAAAHKGLPCSGVNVQVTNCTVHGGWSSWSGWSQCSASCGIAVKSKRRSCTAPEPRFGGRVCVGADVDDMYCTNQPPCPDPALAPVDGGWSAWGLWSNCTASGGAGCGAGGGWRERRRSCTYPAPANGGADCDGARYERTLCDMKPCEVKKATMWTSWVQMYGNSTDGSFTEKRFKILCKAPSPEQLRLSISRDEVRYCSPQGVCSAFPPYEEGGWSEWGAWGACSASCGGGQQTRSRTCRRPPCIGPVDMVRACNMHDCSGEWSCWSEWSECSSVCKDGQPMPGHRTRSRKCLSPEGCADSHAALERRPCLNICAGSEAGWGPWGEWGPCTDGERVRMRLCQRGACSGPQLQAARCTDTDDIDNELYAMPAYSQNVELASFVTMDGGENLSVTSIIGCAVASFVVGILLCLAVVVYCQRRGSRLPWRRQPRVPSSPHYITANQNSYVTVPLKEVPRKAKRQPSFSGISSTSGILLSKSNNISNANNHNTLTTPKLYPKAIANEYDSMGTLRRHSNQPNNKNNLDAEEDKFY